MNTRRENDISSLHSNCRLYSNNINDTVTPGFLPFVSSFEDINCRNKGSKDNYIISRTHLLKRDEGDFISSITALLQTLNVDRNHNSTAIRSAFLSKLESKEGSLALQKAVDNSNPKIFQLIYELVSYFT